MHTQPARRILLVDDEIYFGEILQILLERGGHTVHHFVRARLSDSGAVLLMNIDGKETRLDSGAYDIAFVDGRIKGSQLNGWELTPYLVQAGLPVLAMSGAESINKQLTAAGARQAIRKDLLWDRLRDGSVDFGSLAG